VWLCEDFDWLIECGVWGVVHARAAYTDTDDLVIVTTTVRQRLLSCCGVKWSGELWVPARDTNLIYIFIGIGHKLIYNFASLPMALPSITTQRTGGASGSAFLKLKRFVRPYFSAREKRRAGQGREHVGELPIRREQRVNPPRIARSQ